MLVSGIHLDVLDRPTRAADAFHEAPDTKKGDGMWLTSDDQVRIWRDGLVLS